jgi:hypothetical protein
MNRVLFALLMMVLAFALFACTAGEEEQEDEDLAPVLYQESFEIYPSPAELFEEATFYFGFEDHDGDMDDPTILLLLTTEAEEAIQVQITNLEVLSSNEDKATAGSISFKVLIQDGYEGTYRIVVQDEAGNQSNAVTRFLFVNDVPPLEE